MRNRPIFCYRRIAKSFFWSAGVSPASGFSDASFAYFRHPTKISITGGRDARAPSDFAILLFFAIASKGKKRYDPERQVIGDK